MTVAICVRCGEFKFGAWEPCRACGFQPATPVEKAKSLLATDHYFSPQYLESAAGQLKQGRPLLFSKEQVDSLAKGIEKQDYFYLNFDVASETIPCMKCGKSFPTDFDKEAVLCPSCSDGT